MPNEVYRDEWDDVEVADPMEYTHCRYTPVVTEARGRTGCWVVQPPAGRACGAAWAHRRPALAWGLPWRPAGCRQSQRSPCMQRWKAAGL